MNDALKEDLNLLVEISRLYYEEGKSQREIGEMLGLSRIKVLRLLDKAREEGIVSIKIVDPLVTCTELEEELAKIFPLKKVIVFPSGYTSKALILRMLGKWGSLLLREVLQNGDVLGIGWGSTVAECINQFSSYSKKEVIVVPLGGGTGQIDPMFQVNELTRRVASKLGATWYSLDIPIFVRSKSLKEALLKEPNVKEVVNLWDKLDVALVGIGNVPSLWENYSPLVALSQEFLNILRQDLAKYNGVGDILLKFFDINGKLLPISIEDNLLTITMEQMKRIKNVIAVSGGEDKKEAILGALRLGCITHLVTDETVARYLIEISKKDKLE